MLETAKLEARGEMGPLGVARWWGGPNANSQWGSSPIFNGVPSLTEPEIQVELSAPSRVADLRARLSDPSWLIRQLSQYMGIRCNAEDNEIGHFWQSRYGMTRLLDEAAVLACLA